MSDQGRNFWRAVFDWLRAEKDSLSAISSIVQAFAVVVGVFFAVNEFVIKDRYAEQARVNRALEIFRGPSGFDGSMNLGDLSIELLGKKISEELSRQYFEEEPGIIRAANKAIRRYTEIQACLNTKACDEVMIRQIFCAPAFHDSYVAYKLFVYPHGGPESSPNYDANFDNLFDFYKDCLLGEWLQEYKMSSVMARRNQSWDPVLASVYAELDRLALKATVEN